MTSMERQVSSKEAVVEEAIRLQTSGDLVASAVQVGEEVASLSHRQTTFSNNSSEDETHSRTSSTMTLWEEDLVVDRRNSPMEIKDVTHSGWVEALEVVSSMMTMTSGLEEASGEWEVGKACSHRCRWAEAWEEEASLSSLPPRFRVEDLPNRYQQRRI